MSVDDHSDDNVKRNSDLPVTPPTQKPLPTQLSSPVGTSDRFASVDMLRGFALLGILVINIITMALPDMALNNPTIAGGDTGLDLATWGVADILFFQKFMSIFSMLFGAGLILMFNRAEGSGVEFRKIYYRRLRWLLIIGLIHAYFIWWGDILVFYALVGLILYPLRRVSPRWLIVPAIIMILVASSLYFGIGRFFEYASETAADAQVALNADETLDTEQEMMQKMWKEMSRDLMPSPEYIAQEIETQRGGYAGIFISRAEKVIMLQTAGLVMFIAWFIGGMMLLGMALMKLGVFSGERSTRFYKTMMVIGYGAGLPFVIYGAYRLIVADFNILVEFTVSGPITYVFSPLVALGHVGAVMLAYKNGFLPKLQARLAAVGRMALTNYLMHSIVMTTIFYGYGLGQFNRFSRFELLGFVFSMWALQLYLSPWWLKRFRFGPVEWLWRTVTYRKFQPMRLEGK
ncbi:MAG: DUF418 domain-containing protein [FCB group bacterium]|nr:DUF418 domain-containing protein [FCB group bacterium]